MGQMNDPVLKELAGQWTPRVRRLLEEVGNRTWPPLKEKRGLFNPPASIMRFLIEGPVLREDRILWAVSHTRRPSAFGLDGELTQGLREFWIISLSVQSAPAFSIEGQQAANSIPADENSLKQALLNASATGPQVQSFYGNKGPLSQK
jgi:hypothetical protein